MELMAILFIVSSKMELMAILFIVSSKMETGAAIMGGWVTQAKISLSLSLAPSPTNQPANNLPTLV
jgi:hypothetical protein